MSAPRQFHAATDLGGGKVLVAGGNGSTTNSSQIYDTTANSFTAATVANSMGTARSAHAAVKLGSGLVLIVGGNNGTTSVATTEFFDPLNNTWAAGPAMATARENFAAAALAGDLVLATGGSGNDTSTTTPTDVVITP